MDDQFYSGNPHSRIDQNQIESSSGLDNVALRQLPDIPESFPGPIIGCLCASCKTFFRSAQLTNQAAVDFGNLGSIPKIQSSIKKFKNDLNKLTLLRLVSIFVGLQRTTVHVFHFERILVDWSGQSAKYQCLKTC